MTVQELALAMNLPRTTVIRILNTIVGYGLVVRNDRRYRVTAAFENWCRPDRNAWHCRRYRPVLEAWARVTGELVLLGQLEGAGVVHLDYVESDRSVAVAPAPTTHHNIRHNALGKLFLSERPDLAARWVRSDPEFARELETIRELGVAWNRGETWRAWWRWRVMGSIARRPSRSSRSPGRARGFRRRRPGVRCGRSAGSCGASRDAWTGPGWISRGDFGIGG